MHGLPDNVDLDFLLARQLTQVAVGQFEVQLNFDEGVSIAVFGELERAGHRYAPGAATGQMLLDLLGRSVRAARGVAARHVQLDFDDGTTLLVRESDEPFESYTITGPDASIVV